MENDFADWMVVKNKYLPTLRSRERLSVEYGGIIAKISKKANIIVSQRQRVSEQADM